MTVDEGMTNDEIRNRPAEKFEGKADDGAERRVVIRLSDFLSHPSCDISHSYL
jgi:hypothetical protein